MTSITLTRVVLAIGSIALFLIGVRHDNAPLRWGAVTLLVVAFTLRYYKPKS